MKRSASLVVAAFLAAFYPVQGPAYAQHGHANGMSGSHESNASAGSDHASSKLMASKNSGDVLDHNSHLATRLEDLLSIPSPGTASALAALKTDAGGFKNFGQFVAAAHVSHNLGIPFSDLQAKMTGSSRASLGNAIQESKPAADSKAEAKKAMDEANADVKAPS